MASAGRRKRPPSMPPLRGGCAGTGGWPARGDASVPLPRRTAPAPTRLAGALPKPYPCKHSPRPYVAFIPRGKSALKERLLWGSAAAACGEPAEETYEEVDHAENDEAGEDDIIAGTAAVCLGLGIRVGDRGDDDAYDSHERAAYH